MKTMKNISRMFIVAAFILLSLCVVSSAGFSSVVTHSSPIVCTVLESNSTYSVNYVLDGGAIEDPTYITTFTVDTETTLLPRAIKSGYKFDGWYLDQTFALDKKIDRISQGTSSDVTVYAKFAPINYFVNIVNTSGVEIIADMVSGLTMSTHNSPYNVAITLTEGYLQSTEVALRINNDINIEYYAVDENTYFFRVPTTIVNQGDFTITIENINIDTYELKYVYEESTLIDSRLHNETYVVSDTKFVKNGYTQIGWICNDVEYDFDEEIVVTSSMTFTPLWEVEVYPIMYTLYEGQADNPATYTILDEIEISNPVRPGYNFLGWLGTSLSEPTMNLVITLGSYGTRNYEAVWRLIPYSIEYDLDGGTLIDNITTFTVVTPDIVLSEPVKVGYTFDHWTKDDIIVTKISKGTIGDVSLKAVWSIVNYSITYNLDGGSLSSPKTSYTVLEETTLATPEKEGFVFGGLYESKSTVGNSISKILVGSTGNVQLYATWLHSSLNYNVGKMNASISNTYGLELDVSIHVALLKNKYEIYLCNSYIRDCDFNDNVDYEIKQIFDVYLLKNNAIYNEFTGMYTVKIKLQDPYYKTNHAVVLARDDNGGIEKLETRIDGEYLVFETEHFSRFVLVGERVDTLVGMQWVVFVIVVLLMIVSVTVTVVLVYFYNKPMFEKMFKYISKDFYKNKK